MTFAAALWVVRDRITTKAAIDDLLADSVGWNIRDLVVQVRGRGDAYYTSALEPRAEALDGSDLDPLAHLVRGGAAVGIRIHAWANGTFVWSSPTGGLPRSPAHLVQAHPDWLLRPDGVRYLDPVGGTDWEGIYIDPTVAAARAHTVAVFEDIVRRYPVEGFHHDYIRYPQASYARSPEDHAAVTTIVRETTARVRAARPGIVISAAVFPDPQIARERVLQRWPDWVAEGLIDLICPMAYRTDTAEVRRVLGAARAAAPAVRMWGGLMAYAGERERVRDQVRAARDAGCDGAILFAYDAAKRDVIDAFAAESGRAT
ncbi:MAG: family 10 glycosylhydrolase [Chloroflexota bacterium]|nr:family 10 glycosylhydrolase [Chloroflexota bacterium]